MSHYVTWCHTREGTLRVTTAGVLYSPAVMRGMDGMDGNGHLLAKNSCFPTLCHIMSHDVTQKKERSGFRPLRILSVLHENTSELLSTESWWKKRKIVPWWQDHLWRMWLLFIHCAMVLLQYHTIVGAIPYYLYETTHSALNWFFDSSSVVCS